VTDEGRLARNTLPPAILLSPDIGKTTRAHRPFAFLFYLILVYSGGNGDIPVQMNLHSAVAQWLIMSLWVSDVSQPLTLVHEFSIIVREIECLRKERTESLRIMCDFGLIPSVLKGENPHGFIASHAFGLGGGCHTHRQLARHNLAIALRDGPSTCTSQMVPPILNLAAIAMVR
jgi:hypothetical protein